MNPMNKHISYFCADLSDLGVQMKAMEDALVALKPKAEDRVRSILLLEEVVVKLAEAAGGSSDAKVKAMVVNTPRKLSIKLSSKGSDAGISAMLSENDTLVLGEEYGDEVVEVIRGMIMSSYADRIVSKYSRGVNSVEIIVSKSDKALLFDTMIAIVAGLCAGILARVTLGPEMETVASMYIFQPLYSLFLTAISMVVAPLVFFSIASSISGFTDLKALGRTGGKVFGAYLFTTAIAIALSFGINALFRPGVPGIVELPASIGQGGETITISMLETILKIIPDNFLGAFVASDMIQVMVLAILVGIAIGRMGKYSESVRHFVESANELFGSITSIVSHFLPFAIFGSIGNMALTLDVGAVGALASWAGTVIATVAAMMLCYMVLLALFGRLNPMKFVEKFYPATVTAFMTSSSNATMPTTMECCRKMGLSPKIYSFSIPLGANVNMDGTAICFVLSTLFAAGLYGIEISGATLATFIATVMMISVAAPGVPGAATACLLMLFAIVGIPPEAYGLLIGILPLLELFETASNVTGDGAVSTIVAKSEHALDLEQYNS